MMAVGSLGIPGMYYLFENLFCGDRLLEVNNYVSMRYSLSYLSLRFG